MIRIAIILAAIALAGCAANPYKQFYNAYYSKEDPNAPQSVELLSDGQETRIVSVAMDQLDKEVRALRSRSYLVLGESSFSSVSPTPAQLRTMAKSVGATVVIQAVEYSETETHTQIRSVGTVSNTYGSGQVYGDINAGHSRSSTTYGTQNIPVSRQVRRYNISAVYLAKWKYPGKFGVSFNPLSDNQRHTLQRNTGAVADIIQEGYPAFYANLLPGDILIEVNDQSVMDVEHAVDLVTEAMSSGMPFAIKVIRDQREMALTTPGGVRKMPNNSLKADGPDGPRP